MNRQPAFDSRGRLVAPAAHPVSDLLDGDGTALSHQIASGALSSAELMTACLDRIESLNPTYNAIVSLRPRETILADAREADVRRAAGEPLGPLHGLPIAIKDLAATAGLRTTWGSPLFADHIPSEDDLNVARIRAAGAIIIGKTNVPEFGLGSHTHNPVFGPTRNAFTPELSAGGSSGGAAVALALRLLPIAEGSDFGGSLRNPAGWNNVFGFRPSQGRVPGVPTQDPFYAQLSTNGPMGRSVRDMARMLSILAGADPRAPLSLPKHDTPFEHHLDRARPPVVAWIEDLDRHLPFEEGIIDMCRTTLTELGTAGWRIEPIRAPFAWEELWTAFLTLRNWQNLGRLGPAYADPAKRGMLKPEAVWEVEAGLKLDATALSAAAKVRGACYTAFSKLFESVDAIAMPTAQVFPFPIGEAWPRRIAGRDMDTYHRWMETVVLGTMLGCPVANVPIGFDDQGRSMGLQLIGRPRADAELLGIAAMYERDARRVDLR